MTDPEALDALAAKQIVPGYIGFDATAPSLHVGSLVQIMLLRRLQQAGHKPIVLMGGGTSKIGDPSFKDEARKLISAETIDANIASIRRVFEHFLTFGDGPTDAIMVDNADWLDALEYIPFLREIGQHFSVNRMLSFDSVKLRLDREQSLSFLEFNYMILQAYDFLELSRARRLPAAARRIGPVGQYRQRHRAGPPHGRRRGVRPDHAADHHRRRRQDGQDRERRGLAQRRPAQPLRLLAILAEHAGRRRRPLPAPVHRSAARRDRAAGGAARAPEINDAKKALADAATAMLHGEEAAAAAAETARKTFEEGAAGEDLPTLKVAGAIGLVDALVGLGLVASKNEARRLIAQGGARVDGEAATEDVHDRGRRRRPHLGRQEEARAAHPATHPSTWKSLLAAAQQPHRRVALHQIEQDPRRLAALALQAAVAVDEQAGVVHRDRGERRHLLGAGEAELGLAGLAGAEDLAGAAQAQILLGDAEAVIGLAHQGEAGAGGLAQHRCRAAAGRRCAGRRARPCRATGGAGRGRSGRHARRSSASRWATSTPTSITVVATSTAISPRAKASITASFSGPFIRPWTTPTLSPKRRRRMRRALLGGGEVDRLALLDQRADPISLPARGDMAAEPVDHLGQPLGADHPGLDRLAARRHLVEPADVHLAIMGERQRARDRRRGHHQQMRRPLGLLREHHPLRDAEAMLLVDHREAELLVGDRLLEDGVGADQDVDRAVGEPHQAGFARPAPSRAR